SPCSSVQTARPMRPVALSLKTIASDRKPTAGRDEPVSTRDPLKLEIDARRSPNRRMMLRLPAAVHVPWNSCHSFVEGVDFDADGRRPDAVRTTTLTRATPQAPDSL